LPDDSDAVWPSRPAGARDPTAVTRVQCTRMREDPAEDPAAEASRGMMN
jgi:hypothetical protein